MKDLTPSPTRTAREQMKDLTPKQTLSPKPRSPEPSPEPRDPRADDGGCRERARKNGSRSSRFYFQTCL